MKNRIELTIIFETIQKNFLIQHSRTEIWIWKKTIGMPKTAKADYKIKIQWLQSLQVQGLMFTVETSQSCFFFFRPEATSNEQGQRPQTLPLPTIVTMIWSLFW